MVLRQSAAVDQRGGHAEAVGGGEHVAEGRLSLQLDDLPQQFVGLVQGEAVQDHGLFSYGSALATGAGGEEIGDHERSSGGVMEDQPKGVALAAEHQADAVEHSDSASAVALAGHGAQVHREDHCVALAQGHHVGALGAGQALG